MHKQGKTVVTPVPTFTSVLTFRSITVGCLYNWLIDFALNLKSSSFFFVFLSVFVLQGYGFFGLTSSS